ncbi:unnamed protein product [Prorocentrum cordatum]|uniref:Uncharacterized protein n=1 Tax=Prorocentrum cordatum TaxID=2364126 RepID=A0ABN9S3C7_9DINO|nr:unnamed protein product [Polarella glacialis]
MSPGPIAVNTPTSIEPFSALIKPRSGTQMAPTKAAATMTTVTALTNMLRRDSASGRDVLSPSSSGQLRENQLRSNTRKGATMGIKKIHEHQQVHVCQYTQYRRERQILLVQEAERQSDQRRAPCQGKPALGEPGVLGQEQQAGVMDGVDRPTSVK